MSENLHNGSGNSIENDEPIDYTTLKILVRRVARTFFDGPETIVLDYLTDMVQPVITDFDLGQALRIGSREVNKFCARLVESRLLRMYAGKLLWTGHRKFLC
jgi:transcription initiation factor IIE alpha subunit